MKCTCAHANVAFLNNSHAYTHTHTHTLTLTLVVLRLELSVVKTRGAFCSIYLCPERLSGKSHAYGVESDVWALGISIVEMAQGSHPLGVDVTMIDVMQRLLHGPPIRLSPDSHPSDACEFVALCLNVDPMRRARKYALLLDHPYLNRDRISESDEMAQWIQSLQPNS